MQSANWSEVDQHRDLYFVVLIFLNRLLLESLAIRPKINSSRPSGISSTCNFQKSTNTIDVVVHLDPENKELWSAFRKNPIFISIYEQEQVTTATLNPILGVWNHLMVLSYIESLGWA
ncbi:unnamed protein product [Linum tenue]|uniref:Uncharacterized protein n=1 Tax=Linum tenue TaxID=586396 RepID=A0AAV0MDV6_9ROSI|nr:unnamed protein product [Linum tenue]